MNILLISAFLLYIINYSIGWSLNSGLLKISKRTHQIIYGLLILIVIFALLFTDFSSPGFIFGILSLIALLILPFGKKGGIYHKLVSSTGLLCFLIFIMW